MSASAEPNSVQASRSVVPTRRCVDPQRPFCARFAPHFASRSKRRHERGRLGSPNGPGPGRAASPFGPTAPARSRRSAPEPKDRYATSGADAVVRAHQSSSHFSDLVAACDDAPSRADANADGGPDAAAAPQPGDRRRAVSLAGSRGRRRSCGPETDARAGPRAPRRDQRRCCRVGPNELP